MTTTLDQPTAPPPAPPPAGGPAPRPSLVRAELRRLTSRRFVRVLVVLALLGFLAAVGIASATAFAKTTPAQLAAAQRNIEQVVDEQNGYRQQCLDDPTRPADVPDAACGEVFTGDGFRAEDFLDKQPFELAEYLPAGGIAVAAGTAALAFLLGATSIGAEWSSRSIVALLFWEPRRTRVMAVKLGVLAAAAAALAVVAQALWFGTAQLMARTLGTTGPLPDDFAGDLLSQQARSVLLVVLAAGLGFAVSNLARGTGAALGAGFVWFAVVETAVRGVRPRWQEWLLTDNAAALMLNGGHRIYIYDGGFVDSTGQFVDGSQELVLSNLHGGLVLGVATTALVGVGVLLFVRRDLH